MSYCRFSDGDVYAYETDGGVQFWVSGDNRELDRLCNTFYEAYRYAKELSDVHGLDVPSYAIEALREDALEEAKRISGVVGELQVENAKLRELVNSYADLFEKEAAANNGHGPYYSGEDWLALANDMRIELAKCCGELGIEVS